MTLDYNLAYWRLKDLNSTPDKIKPHFLTPNSSKLILDRFKYKIKTKNTNLESKERIGALKLARVIVDIIKGYHVSSFCGIPICIGKQIKYKVKKKEAIWHEYVTMCPTHRYYLYFEVPVLPCLPFFKWIYVCVMKKNDWVDTVLETLWTGPVLLFYKYIWSTNSYNLVIIICDWTHFYWCYDTLIFFMRESLN